MSCVPSSVRELSLLASMNDIALARLGCASTDVCRKLASAGSAACTAPHGFLHQFHKQFHKQPCVLDSYFVAAQLAHRKKTPTHALVLCTHSRPPSLFRALAPQEQLC